MKFICIIDKDGKVNLPDVITSAMDLNKGNLIELDVDQNRLEAMKIRSLHSYTDEGIPVPFETLEASELLDETNLEVLVMDRAVIFTTHDKILEMFMEESVDE